MSHSNQFLPHLCMNGRVYIESPFLCLYRYCHTESLPLHCCRLPKTSMPTAFSSLLYIYTSLAAASLLDCMERIEHGCKAYLIVLLDIFAIISIAAGSLSQFGRRKDDRGHVGVVKFLGQMRTSQRLLRAENGV